MKSILITGCNRGIGLGLIKTFVNQAKAPDCLIATCRDIAKADELRKIADKHKNVHLLELDVKNIDQYNKFGENVNSIVGENGLNVLFNNAGISTKFTRINLLKPEQMNDAFLVNTIAPIMLTKVLYPNLKKAAAISTNKSLGVSKAAVINMSSILSSMTNNTDGGFYPYRCSKAALNMATRSMCADFKNDNILVVSLHPGWVKTDMGGAKAPMEIAESASAIVNLLHTLDERHNGSFVQFDGTALPW